MFFYCNRYKKKQHYGKCKRNCENDRHAEGKVARAIEQQTAKLPSDVFLWSAVGAMGASLALKLMKKDHQALFVGQWAAPLLILGLYNKLVKVEGHDKADKEAIS